MFQLLLAVMAIALTASLTAVAVNYLPTWQGAAATTADQLTRALPQLEQAYDAAVRANDGVAPAPTGEADGGAVSIFRPILRFMPATPPGFQWVYGRQADDGSPQAGLHFFCMAPSQPLTEGVGRGLYRAMATFSPDQAFINTGCGSNVSAAPPADWRAAQRAVTFYVAYTPGIGR
ncbi:hypothetical protein D3C71_22050 [compost metagenome]